MEWNKKRILNDNISDNLKNEIERINLKYGYVKEKTLFAIFFIIMVFISFLGAILFKDQRQKMIKKKLNEFCKATSSLSFNFQFKKILWKKIRNIKMLTMYIKNRRFRGEFKVCNPLQLIVKLTGIQRQQFINSFNFIIFEGIYVPLSKLFLYGTTRILQTIL